MPLPGGGVERQGGWGFKQSGLVGRAPAYSGGLDLDGLKRPKPFYYSMKSTPTPLQRVFKELRQQILYLKLSQGAKWPSSPRFELPPYLHSQHVRLHSCCLFSKNVYIYTHIYIQLCSQSGISVF